MISAWLQAISFSGTLTFMAVAIFSVARPAYEFLVGSGDHSSPAVPITIIGVDIAVETALLQWPTLSRLMDATDLSAALLDVALAVTVLPRDQKSVK